MIESVPSAIRRALGRGAYGVFSELQDELGGALEMVFDHRQSVRTTGSLVDLWCDISGQGHHAVGVGAGRPTHTGQGVVFNGVAQWLQADHAAGLRAGGGMAVFVVGASSSATAPNGYCGKWDGVTAANDDWALFGNRFAATQGGFGVSEVGTSATRTALTGDCTDGALHIIEGHWLPTTLTASRDGVAGAGVSCAGAKSTGVAAVQIGRYATSGAVFPGWLACRIKAIVKTNRALKAGEAALVRAVLRAELLT